MKDAAKGLNVSLESILGFASNNETNVTVKSQHLNKPSYNMGFDLHTSTDLFADINTFFTLNDLFIMFYFCSCV